MDGDVSLEVFRLDYMAAVLDVDRETLAEFVNTSGNNWQLLREADDGLINHLRTLSTIRGQKRVVSLCTLFSSSVLCFNGITSGSAINAGVSFSIAALGVVFGAWSVMDKNKQDRALHGQDDEILAPVRTQLGCGLENARRLSQRVKGAIQGKNDTEKFSVKFYLFFLSLRVIPWLDHGISLKNIKIPRSSRGMTAGEISTIFGIIYATPCVRVNRKKQGVHYVGQVRIFLRSHRHRSSLFSVFEHACCGRVTAVFTDFGTIDRRLNIRIF